MDTLSKKISWTILYKVINEKNKQFHFDDNCKKYFSITIKMIQLRFLKFNFLSTEIPFY